MKARPFLPCAILCVLAGCVAPTDTPAPAADVPEPAPAAINASPLQEAVAAAHESEAEAMELRAQAMEAAGNTDGAEFVRKGASVSPFLVSSVLEDATAAENAVSMAAEYAEINRIDATNAIRQSTETTGATKRAYQEEAAAWIRSAQAWEAVADTYGGQ